MARKKRRAEWQAGELNLTAMIDVAFQLLNFFVITSHPVDVFTNLDVFRPSTAPATVEVVQTDLIEIMVYKDGYAFQKAQVALEEVERQLTMIASFDKTAGAPSRCVHESWSDKAFGLQLLGGRMPRDSLSEGASRTPAENEHEQCRRDGTVAGIAAAVR